MPSTDTLARRRSIRAATDATAQSEAGPSTPRPQRLKPNMLNGGPASSAEAGPSSSNARAGSSKSVEKRVLPARIRRAAGGGAEGIRDLEEMIVDWLERWGAPCTTPPDHLPLHITTLPLDMVDPPPDAPMVSVTLAPLVTVTPTKAAKSPLLPSPSPRMLPLIIDKDERIETPSWRIVKPGEDDAEEAREEMDRSGPVSPVRRLRHLAMDDAGEDTSDAYYLALHKKYEVFERRQRLREKEKLVFERFKMKSRIDQLRNLSSSAWASIVAVVVSRYPNESGIWAKGRAKVEEAGADWLRLRLVKEGKELVKRYDQLLPSDSKKSRADGAFTPTPTPERHLEPASSLSPPPAVLPARVTALRDPPSQKRGKPGQERSKTFPTKRSVSEADSEPDGLTPLFGPRKKSRNVPGRQAAAQAPSYDDGIPNSAVDLQEDVSETRSSPSPPLSDGDPPSDHDEKPSLRRSTSVRSEHRRDSISGTSYLLEAVTRREEAQEEALAARSKVEAAENARREGKKMSRLIAREKTRTSGRAGLIQPFGMPLPAEVECKSEFTLTEEEDFWGIIAAREAQATLERRNSQLSHPGHALTKEEAEMREVEAAVVL